MSQSIRKVVLQQYRTLLRLAENEDISALQRSLSLNSTAVETLCPNSVSLRSFARIKQRMPRRVLVGIIKASFREDQCLVSVPSRRNPNSDSIVLPVHPSETNVQYAPSHDSHTSFDYEDHFVTEGIDDEYESGFSQETGLVPVDNGQMSHILPESQPMTQIDEAIFRGFMAIGFLSRVSAHSRERRKSQAEFRGKNVAIVPSSNHPREVVPYQPRSRSRRRRKSSSSVRDLTWSGVRISDGHEARNIAGSLLRRPDRGDINHPVGQVVIDNTTGIHYVVVGYDQTCLRSTYDPNLAALENGTQQPFYHLIPCRRDMRHYNSSYRKRKDVKGAIPAVDRYIAQELLSRPIDSSKRIFHPEVRKKFERYDKKTGRYVPRAALRRKYPDNYPPIEKAGTY